MVCTLFLMIWIQSASIFNVVDENPKRGTSILGFQATKVHSKHLGTKISGVVLS